MDFSEQLSKFEIGSKERIFFEKVLEKLGPNFVRKSLEDKKREVHNKLTAATQSYFQAHIYASAVMKAINQLETSRGADPTTNYISGLHLQKYLSDDAKDVPMLFGLSQEDILKAVKYKNSKIQTTSFSKQVDSNINDHCKEFIHCVGGSILPGENWKDVFDRTIKDLENKATLVFSAESNAIESNKQLQSTIKTYYEVLSEGILLLNKLLALHSESIKFHSDVAEYYVVKCHAVSLKIKLLEQNILEATYNEETIPALKKISSHLDQTEQKLKEEEVRKTVRLGEYLKVGEEYDKLVDKYVQLTRSIKEQQWSIDELKQRKAEPCASGHN